MNTLFMSIEIIDANNKKDLSRSLSTNPYQEHILLNNFLLLNFNLKN